MSEWRVSRDAGGLMVLDPTGACVFRGDEEAAFRKLAEVLENRDRDRWAWKLQAEEEANAHSDLQDEVRSVLELMGKVTMYSDSDQEVFSSLRDRLRKAVG